MGWDNVLSCEVDPFCRKVLHHHFPSSTLYGDIRELDGNEWKGKVDILTGGFPCQPFSAAGKRRGTDDNRFLWPEMLRVIREIQPTWIVAENVRGITTIDSGMVFERVCSEMEADGYEVQPFCIPACAVGAPHKRERIWFIGHAKHDGLAATKNTKGCTQRSDLGSEEQDEIQQSARPAVSRLDARLYKKTTSNTEGTEREQPRDPRAGGAGFADDNRNAPNSYNTGLEGGEETGDACRSGTDGIKQLGGLSGWGESWLQAATRLCRVDDGLPRELDGITIPRWRKESLKAYGNAIVPQVAYRLFRAVEEAELSSLSI